MHLHIACFARASGVRFFVGLAKKEVSLWRDTLNGVSRQFYSPTASCIATQ